MKLANGKSADFGGINMTNMRYSLRLLLLFTVLLFVGCSGGQAEYFVKSLSNKYYGIPFDKERITEIRINYWVRVRPEGVYDGIFDTGIRRRILSVTDKYTVDYLLSHLNVIERSPYTLGISSDIEFVVFSEETWNAHFISARKLAVSPGRCLTLNSSRFFQACRALCFCEEKKIRPLPSGAFEWISLSLSDAHKLPILEYDVRIDGFSHDIVYMPKIVDVVEEKRRKEDEKRFKHSEAVPLYDASFWE